MDKSAIQTIEALVHVENINKIIASTSEKTDHSLFMAVPKDYALASLEKFAGKPNRFRGHYITHLIDEFTAYLNDNANEFTGIFVDTIKSTAHAIIDMGDANTAQWGDHTATINLKKTPEFAKLIATKDTESDQLAFIDFIEDWQQQIVFIDGTDEAKTMTLPNAITAIRKLTVSKTNESTSEVGDFAAGMSSTDFIELKAQGDILPKGFYFTCQPYEGLREIRLECRLRAVTKDKEVKLKYRILALDRILDGIGVEFKEHLRANITVQGAQFYCGEMVYQE